MYIPFVYLKSFVTLQGIALTLSYQQPFLHRSTTSGATATTTTTATTASRSPLFRNSLSSRRRHNEKHQLPFFNPNSIKLNSIVSDDETTTQQKEKEDDGMKEEGIGAWIPCASINSLQGLGPQRITIMNIDFVVWHTTPPPQTKEGKKKKKKKSPEQEQQEIEWIVQADACTHRLAPLSQGRVNPETNCIECPYHGWQFDSNGNVTDIPQLDNDRTIQDVQKQKGTKLQTFPTHVVGNLLFVFLPTSLHGEMFPQSILPEQYYPFLNDSKDGNAKYFVRDLPYSFDFLVENFMDPAHIPFAHHKLQSTRDDGMPIQMEELVSFFLCKKKCLLGKMEEYYTCVYLNP